MDKAKAAIVAATALREKEAPLYAKVSGDMKTNIAAMDKAIAAISGGMSGGAFIQTTAVSSIRRLAVDMDISAVDRGQIVSFLSANSEYAPQSGLIAGVLKQMQDTTSSDLESVAAAADWNAHNSTGDDALHGQGKVCSTTQATAAQFVSLLQSPRA